MRTEHSTQELLARARTPRLAARLAAANGAVSRSSRWRSLVWILDTGQNGRQHAYVSFAGVPPAFVDTARMLSWLAMLDFPNHGRLKPSTLEQLAARFEFVFTFLFRTVDRLSDLLPAHFALFLEVARRELARAEGPEGRVGCQGPELLALWRLLWSIRAPMFEACQDAIGFDPFDGSSTGRSGSRLLPVPDERHVQPLPDEVAALIFTSAEDFIKLAGEDVVELQRVVLEEMEREDGRGSALARIVETFPFSRDHRGVPWHVPPARIGSASQALIEVRSLIDEMTGACYGVWCFETAQRPSEIASACGGWDEETSLPRCVERICTGGLQLFLLHGRVYKHEDHEGRPGLWVLGASGGNVDDLPPALSALVTLARLNEPWWAAAGIDRLLVSSTLDTVPAKQAASVGPARHRKLGAQLEKFLARRVAWNALDTSDPAVAEAVFSRGKGVCPERFRKNAPNYFMRLDGSLLGSLRQQLHHGTERETDADYVTNDPRLLEPAGELAAAEVARAMLAMSGGSGGEDVSEAGAVTARVIASGMIDADALRRGLSVEATYEALASLVRDTGIALARTPVALQPVEHGALRGPALLQRYRADRRAWLQAEAVGLEGQFAAVRDRAERWRTALAVMGLDTPADEELA